MVETRYLWEKHRDEFIEKDTELPRKKPQYQYRVGMTQSTESENGVIWVKVETAEEPKQFCEWLQKMYPKWNDINHHMIAHKKNFPEETSYQIWHKELNKYVGIPFDGCCDELFDWERNKDVGVDEKIFAEEHGHKFIPIPGDDIIPDYQATFMFMREPKWHYTVDGVDWE